MRATLTYTVMWKSQRLSLERQSDLFWSFTQALPLGSLWIERCHLAYWVLSMSGQLSARWACPKQGDIAQINPTEVMLRYPNNWCSGNRLLPEAPRWVGWQQGDFSALKAQVPGIWEEGAKLAMGAHLGMWGKLIFATWTREKFIKFQVWPGCWVSVRVLGDTMTNSLWMSFLEKNHIFFKIKKNTQWNWVT